MPGKRSAGAQSQRPDLGHTGFHLGASDGSSEVAWSQGASAFSFCRTQTRLPLGGRPSGRPQAGALRLLAHRGTPGVGGAGPTASVGSRPQLGSPTRPGVPGARRAAAPTRAAPQLQEQDLELSFDPAISRVGLCLTSILTRVLNDIHLMLLVAVFVEAKD